MSTNTLKGREDLFNFAIENGVATKGDVNVIHRVSLPEEHPDHLSLSDATKAVYKGKVKGPAVNKRLADVLVKLVANLYPVAVQVEIENVGNEEKDAVVARADTATETKKRGPKPGTKHRPKEKVEAERAEKELMRQARQNAGLGPRGRLSDEDKEKLAAEVDKLRKTS